MSEGETREEEALPEQTSDDLVDPSDRATDDDPEDLDRFLRDVPPHHGN